MIKTELKKTESVSKTNLGREDTFRDRMATIDESGKRIWIYPRKPKGQFHRYRTILATLLIAIFYSGPFINIGGHPLLLLNVFQREFVIFGQPFYPQDFFLFVLAMIASFVFILLFTVVYGRLWCGWACPQTVFMEMVFRKIEYLIEGNAPSQKSLNKRPMDLDKFVRKILKHSIFFLIAFSVGNTFMAYMVGKEQLFKAVTGTPAENPVAFTSIVLFSLLFYSIFARFREQACTLVCPYGRLQGALLDKNSIVVTYDWVRGEPRMPVKKAEKHDNPGDCINCFSCVKTCPTGIDIHNGTQLECINCTACMDACDAIMDSVKRPRELIRYASFNSIEKGEKIKVDIRMIGYSIVLIALVGILTFLLATRSDIETTILRTPGMLYHTMDNGEIRNLYNFKIINKTYDNISVDFEIESPEGGKIEMVGSSLDIEPRKVFEGACFIIMSPDQLTKVKTPIRIKILSGDRELETVRTSFMGPVSKQ
ncbi:MAG: cytochrome c oxidase accessory protein CcoG [Candidatus Electryonea clarkiae]|nr:cytochrome c oxidase accessory protein CcoG [Candidatus Electryonea clarkiae]MDP8287747.1 cytochrome c oxidase accessory protein CcoG [Candidatus Electryonea clarkiae]